MKTGDLGEYNLNVTRSDGEGPKKISLHIGLSCILNFLLWTFVESSNASIFETGGRAPADHNM